MPAVAFHTDVFRRLVESVIRVSGMPDARYIYVPMPIMGKTAQELQGYIEGNNPVTGRPVLEELVEGLTKPMPDVDPSRIAFDRSTPRLIEPDTEENLHSLFLENNWTDKLPIVLPTEERVTKMLAHTSRKPEDVVGHMRPTNHREFWEYTVEKVAVNAVMSGAKPEYFPVILALAASEVSARPSTSSSAAAMVVVNGPIRHEISMNWGVGAMGPYNHANATIGRAYGLLSQNLQGGSEPMVTYLGSVGNNYAYNNMTIAENEEESPWEAFHVQQGFKSTDSAVSVFGGLRSTSYVLGLREKHWRDHVQYMLRGLGGNTVPTLLLDPLTAKVFYEREGFESKEMLSQWFAENARMPASVYWDYQLVQNYLYPRAAAGEEPLASRLKALEDAPDQEIQFLSPGDVHVVVVGGNTNEYWRMMGAGYRKTVSVDEWR